jgi:hypothetical protein
MEWKNPRSKTSSKPRDSPLLSLNGYLLRRASETIDSLGSPNGMERSKVKNQLKTVQNPAISRHFL